MKGDLTIKKIDYIFIGSLLLIGIGLLIGIKLIEDSKASETAFAKVFYKDELILTINLHDPSKYIVYDTEYQDEIIITYAASGYFYVPGTTTITVDNLDNNIDVPRVKLYVDRNNATIEVLYQESPRDICELQGPTNSSLKPLICLPNELVITVVIENMDSEFIPDGVLS
ncbi:MAG: hypothetical protein WC088_01010 [Candidatus Izemoplasmatales bacterium]|jgi:hypothetical protein|nr:hypothetical protein [Candidatus Izemoplasmatales bacterium]MDD4595537.1 hypothetical protein [Candidatus Izemoplasmatales bacterium]